MTKDADPENMQRKIEHLLVGIPGSKLEQIVYALCVVNV